MQAPLNRDGKSGESFESLARKYTDGTDVDTDQLCRAMAGTSLSKSTDQNTSWAKEKYDFVVKNRAKHLPKDPWELATHPDKEKEVATALAVAIQLVVSGNEVDTDQKKYSARRFPWKTLLLIAQGWGRLIREAKRRKEMASSDVSNQGDEFQSLLSTTGPYAAFRGALDKAMKNNKNVKGKMKGHHKIPTAREHYDVLECPLMSMEYAHTHSTRVSYFMGTQWGLRACHEKYVTKDSDITFASVLVGGSGSSNMRSRLRWTPNGATKTDQG